LVANRRDLIDSYLEALQRELEFLGQARPVDTLYLGGGTPTYLGSRDLQRLLELVLRWFPPGPDCEFTVEANPEDWSDEIAGVLSRAGVNRLSLGVQSFQPRKLSVLERGHSSEQVRDVIASANSTFSLAIDLIFAAPGESLEEWQADLEATIGCGPGHISTYGLTYEKGAAFYGRRLRKVLDPVDEMSELEMYREAISRLTSAGYEHYEVSSFCRPGRASRHNSIYWAGEEYYAAGAGAARHVAGRRETNHRSVRTYIRRLLGGGSPVAETESLAPMEKAREALVFGMRRLSGVERQAFRERFGLSLDDVAGTALAGFVERGLVADDGNRVRLTDAGLVVSDSIWPEILAPRRSGDTGSAR
jgi:oxygen-independent coproporphyrinogen-3 oxidase